VSRRGTLRTPAHSAVLDPDRSGAQNVRVLLPLILILLVVALPVAYLVWRFKRGEEAVSGGSDGAQLFGRKKNDWGPK